MVSMSQARLSPIMETTSRMSAESIACTCICIWMSPTEPANTLALPAAPSGSFQSVPGRVIVRRCPDSNVFTCFALPDGRHLVGMIVEVLSSTRSGSGLHHRCYTKTAAYSTNWPQSGRYYVVLPSQLHVLPSNTTHSKPRGSPLRHLVHEACCTALARAQYSSFSPGLWTRSV